MKTWYMLALVGQDKPGIVAAVSRALFEGGCSIGEASMSRLGENFSMMLMVHSENDADHLRQRVRPVAEEMNLLLHVDAIGGDLHRHVEPDVKISIYGADRAGIVAEATGAFAEAGLNILNLESDVGGTPEKPIFIMNIEGVAGQGFDALERACEKLSSEKQVETHLSPIDTVMG